VVCSQIWLNYFLDDRHLDYVTKSLKETLHDGLCIVIDLTNSEFLSKEIENDRIVERNNINFESIC